jgi:hypothetical protein
MTNIEPVILSVCKADPIGREAVVPGAILHITDMLPQHMADYSLDNWYRFCDEQAQVVVMALNHLPQSVWGRVLAIMLNKHAAHMGYKGTDLLD